MNLQAKRYLKDRRTHEKEDKQKVMNYKVTNVEKVVVVYMRTLLLTIP